MGENWGMILQYRSFGRLSTGDAQHVLQRRSLMKSTRKKNPKKTQKKETRARILLLPSAPTSGLVSI